MPITHLEHFLVLTDDIEATLDFYRDVLGLTVGPRPPLSFTGYWLYAGGAPCVHIAERASYTASSAPAGIPVSACTTGTGPFDHAAFIAKEQRRRRERHHSPSRRVSRKGEPLA